MSRAVLVKCTVCQGKGNLNPYPKIPCTCCKGVGMVAPLPGLSGGSCRTYACPKGHETPTRPCTVCEEEQSKARIALREAALNYAAARLLSHSTADIINTAFEKLEEAATKYTEVKK